MPTFAEMRRQGYRLHRSASNGAHITLVAAAGEFTALFECATRLSETLGNRALEDQGDGIFEVVPFYRIATEDLFSALQKLTQRFSVALVEYTMTRNGGQYVCLCKLPAAVHADTPPPQPTPAIETAPSLNLDDY